MYRHVLSLVLVGFLASQAAWAEREGGRRGGRRAGRGARRGDPLMNMEQLSKRLKLDQVQQTQIQPLVEEYAQAARAIHEATPQDVRQRRRQLMMEMRQARKAEDKEKVKELQGQLRELRKNDPQAQEMMKLRQGLVAKIEPILREDQKPLLRRMGPGAGKAGGPPTLENPRFLRTCLAEVTLRPEQRAELKKIEKEFKEASKGLGKDAPREKRVEMGKQYCNEVIKILDPAQKQQLEEIAKRGPNKMAPLMRSPKMLERALSRVELRPDQQTNIDALKERHKTDLQAAGKGRQARMELNRKLVEDVVKLLDEDQKKELMKRPGGRKGRKGGKKPKAEG